MSIHRFWPADRIDRFKILQKAARKHGFKLKAVRQRPYTIPQFYLSFTKDGLFAKGFMSLDRAEDWLFDDHRGIRA